MTTLRTALVLGRVSNLPTVWTNAVAGVVLSGGALETASLIVLIVALSLFYTGGMYLNDAFDAEIDQRERANRPIPRGEIGASVVLALGWAQLVVGALLAFWLGIGVGFAAIGLGIAVVAYDALHKRTKLSPVLMGLCRVIVYGMAASAAASFSPALAVGAIGLFCYVVGLTYAAKQEAYDRLGAAWPLGVLAVPMLLAGAYALDDPLAIVLWLALVLWVGIALRFLFRRQKGDVPRAVVSLIAGIALYDAVLIAGTGAIELAALAMAGFVATLALQRVAPGT